jgi:glycosyltransferase involved in cell wall biosynthesis
MNMKIGIITTSFPRWEHDYVGSFIYEAARAIQKKGFQIKVITMHYPGTPRYENWDGIEVLRTKYLPDSWELLKSEGGGLPEVWKNKPKARIQIVPFIIAFLFDILLNTRDCDLLHANWTLAGAIAWVCNLLTQKKYVVTVHGSDIYKSIKLPFITCLTRITLGRAKKVIVVSRALADQVNSIGIPYSKIAIVPDGVDITQFTPIPYNERMNNILFVGSLIERKGVWYLIQAFATVVKQLPEMHLIIIGEGAQRIEIEQLAQSLGISENVSLTGPQSQERVAEAMRHAKIFILPSIEEGLGVVLIEAIASGTPIVASNVGGISEVVDDSIGILVPPANVDQLGKAILTILNSLPDEWNYFHYNARKRAEELFDWTRIAERLVKFYVD